VSSRIVIYDERLAGFAGDAAAEFEGMLGERPGVTVESPAEVQLDGDLVNVVLYVGDLVASGVVGAMVAGGWQSAKKIFRKGVRDTRERGNERGFQLQILPAGGKGGGLRLKNLDLESLESVDASDRFTEAQLRPFEEIVIPALRWWQDSSDPPSSVQVTAEIGSGRERADGLWQVLLEFPDGETAAFSVEGDAVSWSGEPDRPVPAILLPRG
jgi:hypothetical protein